MATKISKTKLKEQRIAKYLAQLPELDIFTEADSIAELQMNINDLICTFFDIPLRNRHPGVA